MVSPVGGSNYDPYASIRQTDATAKAGEATSTSYDKVISELIDQRSKLDEQKKTSALPIKIPNPSNADLDRLAKQMKEAKTKDEFQKTAYQYVDTLAQDVQAFDAKMKQMGSVLPPGMPGSSRTPVYDAQLFEQMRSSIRNA